jgi:hypothetical protein
VATAGIRIYLSNLQRSAFASGPRTKIAYEHFMNYLCNLYVCACAMVIGREIDKL